MKNSYLTNEEAIRLYESEDDLNEREHDLLDRLVLTHDAVVELEILLEDAEAALEAAKEKLNGNDP